MNNESPTALADFLPVVDPAPWLQALEDRFGIDPGVFTNMVLFRPNTSRLFIVCADHQLPARPPIDATGMPFMRVNNRFPKLTTAAALAFGHAASRNTIPLTPDQADAFYSRREFCPSNAQLENCTGTGYVLLRLDELTIGVGFLRMSENQEAGADPAVSSMFPKAWATSDNISVFEPYPDT